jgi:hypothetical protein
MTNTIETRLPRDARLRGALKACRGLAEAGKPITVVAVTARLRSEGISEAIVRIRMWELRDLGYLKTSRPNRFEPTVWTLCEVTA